MNNKIAEPGIGKKSDKNRICRESVEYFFDDIKFYQNFSGEFPHV